MVDGRDHGIEDGEGESIHGMQDAACLWCMPEADGKCPDLDDWVYIPSGVTDRLVGRRIEVHLVVSLKLMIVLPKKKRRHHHVNPTASAVFTEQEAIALLAVAESHYQKDPERPWLVAAQTRAVKKLHECLALIVEKKQTDVRPTELKVYRDGQPQS